MSTPYRTRFAPSPTGRMHMGHARTSLVTWLRARSLGGKIVMRMEDLDGPRVVPGAADSFLRDHELLGLDWDEGPFFQSERMKVYETALADLRRMNRVYACTCSRKDIARVASAPHGEFGRLYPGTCRNGATQPQRPEATRFRSDAESVRFDDGLLPSQHLGEQNVDDFVVRRADGVWSYQFAVVVDDADMNVAEVVRGSDLLASTPRQIALFRALGHREPAFVHVPLVHDDAGKRLSNRHSSVTVSDYRAMGWTNEAIVGWLGYSLGITPTPAPIRTEELVPNFVLDKVPLHDLPTPPMDPSTSPDPPK